MPLKGQSQRSNHVFRVKLAKTRFVVTETHFARLIHPKIAYLNAGLDSSDPPRLSNQANRRFWLDTKFNHDVIRDLS